MQFKTLTASAIYYYKFLKSSLQGSCELGYFIKKGQKVLDIGCGYGISASIAYSSCADWTGLEIDSKRCAAIKNAGLNCLCGTIEDIKTEYINSFDIVLASQVIEHTINPSDFVNACSEVLRPGGRLILSTPNVNSRYRKKFEDNWIHWHVPYHQTIFSAKGLALLGIRHGLELVGLKTITPTPWYLFQQKYQKPPRGSKCTWYAGSFSKIQIFTRSLLLRPMDLVLQRGDAMVVEFKKI
jgi:SAM-dependent methyltransferase